MSSLRTFLFEGTIAIKWVNSRSWATYSRYLGTSRHHLHHSSESRKYKRLISIINWMLQTPCYIVHITGVVSTKKKKTNWKQLSHYPPSLKAMPVHGSDRPHAVRGSASSRTEFANHLKLLAPEFATFPYRYIIYGAAGGLHMAAIKYHTDISPFSPLLLSQRYQNVHKIQFPSHMLRAWFKCEPFIIGKSASLTGQIRPR